MVGEGQPDEVGCRGARRDTTGAAGAGPRERGRGLRSAAVARSTTSEL
jgi:hypothetical protein